VRSTTANCFSLVSRYFCNTSCARMLPPIINGIIKRPIRKVFVRTAALYSRNATTMTLRIAIPPRPRNPHEDVVQRRPAQLEVPHPPALRQQRQQCLAVGPLGQTQLLPAAQLTHLDHSRQVAQTASIPLDLYPHRVAAVGVLDGLQGAVEHLPAV